MKYSITALYANGDEYWTTCDSVSELRVESVHIHTTIVQS